MISSTGRYLRVGTLDRLVSELVQVAIEAHYRQVLDRRARQRVPKPTSEELDLIVQEAIASEVVLACRLNRRRRTRRAGGARAALAPFRDTLARLETIPGVGREVAEVIIAETGADMSRFPTTRAPRVLGRGRPRTQPVR
jgi:transposase